MSAPQNAEPIGPDVEWTQAEREAFAVMCPCGWTGHVTELLGTNDDAAMWCPRCKTIWSGVKKRSMTLMKVEGGQGRSARELVHTGNVVLALWVVAAAMVVFAIVRGWL